MGLNKKIEDFRKSIDRLKEAYQKSIDRVNAENYTFFRDSCIQRFEFTVEILWKTVKQFLLIKEGIDCRSPKGCIKELFSAGYVSEEEAKTLLSMIDDRNMTFHTYHEEVAEKIFNDIKRYIMLIEKVYSIIEENIYD